jgi:hypothetical protein
MAYSVPVLAVANAPVTPAQWNAGVRDNMLETPAAKFTATGQILISTGPNAGAARTMAGAKITGGVQTTTLTVPSFGDLITSGPTVAAVTGTAAIVILTSMIENTVAGGGGYMGYTITGATTITPTVERALRFISSNANERNRGSAVMYQTGLNAGTNTFQSKYSTPTGGTGGFDEREIFVLPL